MTRVIIAALAIVAILQSQKLVRAHDLNQDTLIEIPRQGHDHAL